MRRLGRLLLPLLLTGLVAALGRWSSGRTEAPVGLPGAEHERSDVGVGVLFYAGLGMFALLAALMGLSLWLYPASLRDKPIQTPLPSFPTPRLQTDPPRDMAAFRALQLRQVEGTYFIDRGRNQVHIPIGQAMRDVAGRGIADWPVR